MKQKIVVFGTGNYYQQYKDELQTYEIIAFLDNDCSKHGKFLDGIRISPVSECVKLIFDYIILLSKYENEMKEQLSHLNVPQEKILMMEDFLKGEVEREYKVYTNKLCNMDFNVLIVSNSLSLTGAPIVLLNVARILKEAGYVPVFLSNADGKLRENVLEMGIPVIVEKHLETFSYKLQSWIEQFEFIVINTFLYHKALLNCNLKGKRILWWLHEGPNYYCNNQLNYIDRKTIRSIKLIGVGSVACKSFEEAFGIRPQSLIYGIDDVLHMQKKENRDVITFAIIGSIIRRKGTDIFVEAIRMLSPILREKAEFLVIGECTEKEMPFYNEIVEVQKKIPQISILGEIDYEEMQRLYEKIDVLVCPSRIDPMPVVIAEAMSRGMLCIVSDKTGTAQYIRNNINGIIINIENANELVREIEDIISNPIKIDQIGREARKIYEEYFSMNTFKRNLMNIVDNLII